MILPQAMRIAVPGIINLVVDLFKDTTLVSVVGLFDLMGVVNQSIKDQSWLGLAREGYVFAAVVFFLCCLVISLAGSVLERRLSQPGHAQRLPVAAEAGRPALEPHQRALGQRRRQLRPPCHQRPAGLGVPGGGVLDVEHRVQVEIVPVARPSRPGASDPSPTSLARPGAVCSITPSAPTEWNA